MPCRVLQRAPQLLAEVLRERLHPQNSGKEVWRTPNSSAWSLLRPQKKDGKTAVSGGSSPETS